MTTAHPKLVTAIICALAFIVGILVNIANGQLVTTDAKEYGNGEAIPFICNAQPGDEIEWTLLWPRGRTDVVQIRTRFGVEYIVDPPCGYSGTVEVLCYVFHPDGTRERQELLIGSNLKDEPVGPDPPPIDPVDPDEYTGANEYGIGQVSFDNAPEYSEAVSQVWKDAALYLYGQPTKKVLQAERPELNQTEYNVFVWLRNEMQRVGGDEWQPWYAEIKSRLENTDTLTKKPVVLNDWYDVFNEVAAGIEGKQ